jgi:WD40 repeat protein
MRQSFLLKLHGDYLETDSRVLTRSDYEREYKRVDKKRPPPLPTVLQQVCGGAPLLFLGCSLQRDRTTRIIARVAKILEGTMHFAVLSDSENTHARFRELDSWGIRPLFYPEGEYGKIADFLACLARAVPERPVYRKALNAPPRIFKVPLPPAGLVPRDAEVRQAKEHLLRGNGVRSSLVLTGGAGFGKTTLAQAICADSEVQDAFPHGILWATVGRRPNIKEALRGLLEQFTGSIEGSAESLKDALKGRTVLIVIDDVWTRDHLKAFLDETPDMTRLITTRNLDITDPDVEVVRVEEMREQQAMAMLLTGIRQLQPHSGLVRELARRLGYWPLLLELANSRMRTLLRKRDATLVSVLSAVSNDFAHRGLATFDEAVVASIELSLELLSDTGRQQFLDLAIFPEDTSVPSAVAAEMWGIDLRSAQDLLWHLDDLSLLKQSFNDDTFFLHDVLRDWLRGRDSRTSTHARLVERWGDLFNLPHAYAWRWIGWHLQRANRIDEIQRLLINLSWIRAKLEHSDLDALVAEYDLTSGSRPHMLVQRALTQSAAALGTNTGQLAIQLYSRLMQIDEPELVQLKSELRAALFYFVPLVSSVARADDPLLCTLEGHTSGVGSGELSSDGRIAVSASSDDTVRIWDCKAGRELRRWAAQTEWAYLTTLDPSGELAAAVDAQTTIVVWRCATGKEVRRLHGHVDLVTALGFSADGLTLVSGSRDGAVKLWESWTGTELRSFKAPDMVTALALRSGDHTLFAGDYKGNILQLNLLNAEETQLLACHADYINLLSLHANGRSVLSGSLNNEFRVWDLQSGSILAQFELELDSPNVKGLDVSVLPPMAFPINRSSALEVMTHLAVSADWTLIAGGCLDNAIRIWDTASKQILLRLNGHTRRVQSLSFSGDGKLILSASDDSSLKLWDLHAAWAKRTLEPVRELARRKGRTASNPAGPRHGRATFTPIEDLDLLTSLAWSTDQRTILSVSGWSSIKLWDSATGRELETRFADVGHITGIATTGDAIVIAGGLRDDGIVQVREIASWRKLQVFEEQISRVTALALSPDGLTAALGYETGVVSLWDLHTRSEVRKLEGHMGEVTSLCFSGQMLGSGSSDGTIGLWDLSAGIKLHVFAGHTDRITSVRMGPHQRTLFSGSQDSTIGVWDCADRHLVRSLRLHGRSVEAIALTADGGLLVSASTDATIRVWDLQRYDCVDTYSADAPFYSMALAGNDVVAAGDASGRIHLLQLTRPQAHQHNYEGRSSITR